jgi:hypothetical protein
MNIYVRRGGKLLGPFSAGDVQALVDKGNFSLTDDACIAGSKENWKSLREVLPTVRSAVPPNFSLSQTTAGSSDEIDHSTDEVGKLQVAEAFAPVPNGRISRLASVGKLVGTWLLGVAFLAVIILTLAAGGKVATWVQPWVQALAGLSVVVLLPISLLLLVSRRTRGYGGVGIYFASFPVGLSLWVTCFVYAASVSIFWTVAGVLLGGFGILPIAAIMTLIRRDWPSFGGIIGTVVVVFVLRGFGAWIVDKSEEWNAAAKCRAEAARDPTVKRGNYFIRHWRGQLSLGVSYWVNGFLASFVVAIVAGSVAAAKADLRTYSALLLAVFALAIIASVWQGVGVWRSASNHFSRGGTHFWAGTAKVMVILGFLGTSGVIWRTYIPQSAELISILAGDTGIPPYQIQVLPGGTEIEFRGGLRAGSARELERIFSAVPRARVLHIESPGGRIAEAKQMMQLVRQHNLTTYTSEYCLSAATLVLIAGKERVIAANAKVGFHAGSFPGLTVEQQREMNDLLRSTMQSAGISQRFIDRVVATPGDQMWYPSFEEMRINGVVASESYGERFAVSWAQSDADVDNVIKKIGDLPWFRTLRELEPKLYAKMIDDFGAAIKSGKSEGEAMSVAWASAVGVIEKYFPAASDDALLSLLRNEWIAILSNYRTSNSRACIAVLGGSPDSNVNFARAFPDWDMSRTLVILENVMRTGASKIPVPIDKGAASDDLQRIVKSLTGKYGNDLQLLDKEREWMDNSQRVCDMLLAMYQQIASLPNERAANVVRYLVTVNSNKHGQPATPENSTNSNRLSWLATPSDESLKLTTSTPPEITYRVVNMRPGDVLNLRAGPGSNYPLVAKVRAGTRGIKLGHRRSANGTTMWQEISVPGYTGWVNEIYLVADQP